MNSKSVSASAVETVSVSIRASLEKPSTTGSVEIVTFTAKERSRRALKNLGICWGIAICCAPIPLIHFTVLPCLLVAGVVMFIRTFAQESLVLGGKGVCPECGKPFVIAKATNRFPMDELCESCHSSVSIDRT